MEYKIEVECDNEEQQESLYNYLKEKRLHMPSFNIIKESKIKETFRSRKRDF